MDGSLGQHIIADLYGVDEEHLKDVPLLTDCLFNAANRCLLTNWTTGRPCVSRRRIDRISFTGESHISLHTYPEHHFIGIDLFSCGKGDPMNAICISFGTVAEPRKYFSCCAGNELNPD